MIHLTEVKVLHHHPQIIESTDGVPTQKKHAKHIILMEIIMLLIRFVVNGFNTNTIVQECLKMVKIALKNNNYAAKYYYFGSNSTSFDWSNATMT